MSTQKVKYRAIQAVMGGVLWFAAINSAWALASCERQPLTPDRLEWLARDVVINGMAMSVARITLNRTSEEIQRAVAQYWTQARVAAKGFKGPAGWTMVALEDHCQYIVRIPLALSAANQTVATLSVARFGAAMARDLQARIPSPGRILSDTGSTDPLARANTAVYLLDGVPELAARRYIGQLRATGWNVVSDAPATHANGVLAGIGLNAQRANMKLDGAIFQMSGKTYAVLTITAKR